MQFLPKHHHIALAIATYVGLTSLAQADTTPFDRQERGGLMLNIPFDSNGLVFKDTVLSLVFQSAKVKSSTYGWQLAFGSKLNTFSPVFAVSALGGDRCAYGTVGVSYGEGQWGLPVSLHGPYIQLGMRNVGGFGGFQTGLSTLGCFKRYVAPVASPVSAPAPVLPPSSGASSPQVAQAVDSWLRTSPGAVDFDWA